VVDDDPFIHLTLKNIISSKLGVKPDKAFNGLEGKKMV
jgi:hypothetical protein